MRKPGQPGASGAVEKSFVIPHDAPHEAIAVGGIAAPERKKTTTWAQFIRSHLAVLEVAMITAHPNERWTHEMPWRCQRRSQIIAIS